jgi:hypothetical protein
LPHRSSSQTALIAAGLILFMAFSVFAFAATEDWSAAACEVLLFLLAGWVGFRDPGFLSFPRRLWAPFLVVLILLAVGLVQLVPMPKAFWRWTGDERGVIQERAVEGEARLRSDPYRTDPLSGRVAPQDAGAPETPKPRASLPATFTPALTLRAWVALWAALLLLLLLEALAKSHRNSLRVQAWVVGTVGLAVGFWALVHFREAPTKVLGVRESTHAGGSFGPFINENNGMGFVNLAFFMLYYLLWRRASREKHLSNKMGLGIAALGILAFHAILLAIRTSVAGFWPLLLLPLVVVLHALRGRPRLALALGLGVLASLVSLSLFALHFRFTDLHGRLDLWRNALDQSHWLIGNGLGSFGERFQAVLQDLPVQSPVHWIYPENEYLQLFFEAGLPGLLAALLALGFVLHLGWRALMAGGCTFVLVPALWGEALHAATDFSLHLWPVVFAALLLMALVDLALDREHSRVRDTHQGGPRRA